MDLESATVEDRHELVRSTWERIGFRLRPVRDLIFVRTEPPPERIGSIIMPPKAQRFYGPLAMPVVRALVLAVGPRSQMHVAQVVSFIRAPFIRFLDFPGESKIGWVSDPDILFEELDELEV